MKIRIISDLHLDVNADYPLKLADNKTKTVVCGDVAGNFETASAWLDNNVKNGVMVAGNHIVYNHSPHSIQYLTTQYEKCFPLTAPFSFLHNSFKIIDDVVFVGGTLWTDYNLFGQEQQGISMWAAKRALNDFRYGQYNAKGFYEKETEEDIQPLQPEHCVKMFAATLKKIDEVCQQFADKKIVVVTHHAPSIESMPPHYQNSTLAPSYISNLDDFILSRQNIKLWCHGHIHAPADYQIGQCRVVCNPRGYVSQNENPAFAENFMVEI